MRKTIPYMSQTCRKDVPFDPSIPSQYLQPWQKERLHDRIAIDYKFYRDYDIHGNFYIS